MKKDEEFTIADTFFKFPIRIYDEVDIQRVRIEEEKEEIRGADIQPKEPVWVLGFARIPYRLAKDLYWIDAYSKTRSPEDVEAKGFDFTYVTSIDGDIFSCAWKREKFEKYYFEYMEEMEIFNARKKGTDI